MGRNGKMIEEEVMRKIYLMIIVMLFGVLCTTANAESVNASRGHLYVNDVLVESSDTVLIKENMMLFPLRTIFEELGASVNWDKETGNTEILYDRKSYTCFIKEPNPGYNKYFYVRDNSTEQYIYLTNMSFGGLYFIINDRTYLYSDTAEHLFKSLGCRVEIETDTKTVRIYD